jgi:hypothetical protein
MDFHGCYGLDAVAFYYKVLLLYFVYIIPNLFFTFTNLEKIVI